MSPRVSIVRIFVAAPPPVCSMPSALDYPDAYDARNALFSLIDRAHIVRMDARELEPEEFDRLRNNDYQPPRRFRWALLLFWSIYLAASAVFTAWLAGHF